MSKLTASLTYPSFHFMHESEMDWDDVEKFLERLKADHGIEQLHAVQLTIGGVTIASWITDREVDNYSYQREKEEQEIADIEAAAYLREKFGRKPSKDQAMTWGSKILREKSPDLAEMLGY